MHRIASGLLRQSTNKTEKLPIKEHQLEDLNLPEEFDARKQWNKCANIKQIRNQGNCGSCWAFGTVSAIQDRVCIHTGQDVQISAEDLLSCCPQIPILPFFIKGFYCGFGCNGGWMDSAYQFYETAGLVTGGELNSGIGCKPYTIKNCDSNDDANISPFCGLRDDEGHPFAQTDLVPVCTTLCSVQYKKQPGKNCHQKYTEDKHYGNSPYSLKSETQIMADILKNGPVTAGMDVYSDFFNYRSGKSTSHNLEKG